MKCTFMIGLLLSLISIFQLEARHYKRVEMQTMHQGDGNAQVSMRKYISSETVINNAYEDISGHLIPDKERAAKKKQMLAEQEIVYGEITHDAVAKLLQELKLTEHDVVYDLGSGVGKFCMQVAIDSPAKKVVGVELCPTRHMNAVKATTLVEDDVKISIEKRLFFKEEDFLKTDISDATVVFMCSTCYSEALMLALTKKLIKLNKGLRVLTLTKLPEYKEKGKEFVLVKIIPELSMSWGEGSDVYLYELRDIQIKHSQKVVKKPFKKKHVKKSKKLKSKKFEEIVVAGK